MGRRSILFEKLFATGNPAPLLPDVMCMELNSGQAIQKGLKHVGYPWRRQRWRQ